MWVPVNYPQGMSERPTEQVIRLDPRNMWRIGFIALAIVAIGLLAQFLIEDGGGVFFHHPDVVVCITRHGARRLAIGKANETRTRHRNRHDQRGGFFCRLHCHLRQPPV